MRIFRRLETLAHYLKGVGIPRFDVDAVNYDPSTPSVNKRPDRAATMKAAHQAAAHTSWLKAEIQEAIAEDSLLNAAKMVDLIERKFTPLAKHPGIDRVGHTRGTRELLVHESYVAIYREVSAKVEILRVTHTAQQWP